MDEIKKNERLYYENAVENLELGEYWKRYIAELTFELCGMETEIGDAIIKKNELTTCDPLKIPELLKLLKEKNMTALGRRVWNAQIRICLPMIEMERCGYITAQYGLLQGVMSSEYWDDAEGEYKVLCNPQEGEAGDPYELNLATLKRMAYLKKRLVMLGTVSYAPFFRITVNDKNRIAFIADLQNRLTHFRLCSPEELEILFAGHEEYLER